MNLKSVRPLRPYDVYPKLAFEDDTCLHREEERTETDWGPPYGRRMTWTCRACGEVRGRVGAE